METCVAPAEDLLHKGKADEFFPEQKGENNSTKKSTTLCNMNYLKLQCSISEKLRIEFESSSDIKRNCLKFFH